MRGTHRVLREATPRLRSFARGRPRGGHAAAESGGPLCGAHLQPLGEARLRRIRKSESPKIPSRGASEEGGSVLIKIGGAMNVSRKKCVQTFRGKFAEGPKPGVLVP